MVINTILVPLDGSPLSEAALPAATDLARTHGARIVLLRAADVSPLVIENVGETQAAALREAEEYLAGVRKRLTEAGVKAVEGRVWYGPPAQAIVDAATSRKADLIVMSTHGRSGLGRLLLGSVADTVIRSTALPVLLIRPENAPVASRTQTTAREAARS